MVFSLFEITFALINLEITAELPKCFLKCKFSVAKFLHLGKYKNSRFYPAVFVYFSHLKITIPAMATAIPISFLH